MINNIDLSIITPVKDKAPYLRGFVNSLLEQDIWEKMELIMVENGSTDKSWEEMNNIYNKLGQKRRENIHLIKLDKAGACEARNKGAEIAKDRYWSFLPADSALFPGIARIWVESLDEYPEYGFLYGGYRFSPPHGGVFMSEPYDEYFIKQYNYIDGSMPFRKELFPKWNNGGWDPNIPSLQDWFFYLAISVGEDKKGGKTKGLYRPDIFFETLPPQPGGLSDHSHNNWLSVTKQIKDKGGIKESEICVASPGAPFHAKNVAKLLEAEFRYAPQTKPHNFKLIYLLGFYPNIAKDCSAVFTTVDGKLTSATKLVHWVGTDIWGLMNSSLLNVKNLRNQFDANKFFHLTEFEQTQAEMKELGFETEIQPLSPSVQYEVMPLPKKFTVAVYIPSQNAEFYYKDLMYEVAKELPDIDFLFYGDRFNQSKDKNIQHVGYIEPENMGKFLQDCSALVRLTVHDGFPISLMEFVMAGRNVLFNIRLPHVLFVNSGDKELIKQRIKDMQQLPLNVEGSKYYRELVEPEKFRQKIYSYVGKSGYDPKKYWEARADGWELQAGHDQIPFENEIKQELTNHEFKTVLDIGCGNGRYVPLFNGVNYVGFDVSSRLVSFAKQFHPDKTFYVSDVRELNTGKTHYDLGFTFTTLQHVDEEDMARTAEKLKNSCDKLIFIKSTGFGSAD